MMTNKVFAVEIYLHRAVNRSATPFSPHSRNSRLEALIAVFVVSAVITASVVSTTDGNTSRLLICGLGLVS
jgi:hypothetical protein